MTTQHPKRAASQRWRSERKLAGRETLIVTGTLGDRLDSDDGWKLTDVERSDGIGAFCSCFVDSLWTNSEETMTLLAPAPSKAPVCKAPEGYVKCDFGGCPRWAWKYKYCNVCAPGPASHQAAHPDWTPPLESKPAETPVIVGIDFGVNSDVSPAEQARIRAALIGTKPAETVCPWINPIDCGGCPDHAPWAVREAKPPAQEAPKALVCRIVLQAGREHGGAVLERVWRSPLGVKKGAVCENCRSWQEQSIAEKMLFESSGKPYAGPERMPKAKMMHSMGVEDPALEDAP